MTIRYESQGCRRLTADSASRFGLTVGKVDGNIVMQALLYPRYVVAASIASLDFHFVLV
jgi:hypothetical protein